MEDSSITALKNSIKQPAPDIESGNSEIEEIKKIKREFNVPNVGVVSVPNISKTPLSDTLELKKEENPHTIYKLPAKKIPGLRFNTVLSLGIASLGFLALIKEAGSLLKRIKK